MTDLVPDGIEQALSIDEAGIETARFGPFVLKSAYQPIFRRFGAKLVPIGVEALVRPFREGAPVAPAAFFEDVAPDDAFLVESLCRALHLRNYRLLAPPGLRLFFNFAPHANGDLDKVVERLRLMVRRMGELGVDLSLLVCEITETEAMSEATLSGLVAQFRQYGVRIAVDDFGSGFSTIERIELIAPDIVKIDGGWFRRVASEPAAARLLAPLFVGLHRIGSEVLVEGIETQAQIDTALEAGADYLQGFLLGRPAIVGSWQDLRPRSISLGDNVTSLFAGRQIAPRGIDALKSY